MVSDITMTMEEQEKVYDQLDEHGFYKLPTRRDINDHRTLESFISEFHSPIRERLIRTISGRGAFRRFKDELYQLGVQDLWYDYQKDEHRKLAIRWCEENGLEWKEYSRS